MSKDGKDLGDTQPIIVINEFHDPKLGVHRDFKVHRSEAYPATYSEQFHVNIEVPTIGNHSDKAARIKAIDKLYEVADLNGDNSLDVFELKKAVGAIKKYNPTVLQDLLEAKVFETPGSPLEAKENELTLDDIAIGISKLGIQKVDVIGAAPVMAKVKSIGRTFTKD